MDALIGSDGVDGDDSRVLQLAGRLCLVAKPGDLLIVEQAAVRQHLEGDATVQRRLPGFVHHSHPASTDLPHDPKIAQLPSICGGRWRPVARNVRWLKTDRRILQQVQAIQILAERSRQFRVFRQHLIAVQRRAVLDSQQVRIKQLR